MAQLTINSLRAPWRGKDKWLSDGGVRGGGRLVARVTREGVAMLFKYFDADGRKRLMPLGPYDMTGARGLSLPKARDRAAALSALYRAGTTDLHHHFARQRDADEQARKAAEDATRRAQQAAQRSTLRQLLDAYVGHLERLGKQSAKDVRLLFAKRVHEAAPDIADRKAAEVTVDEFVELLGRLTEAGKGRTAAKLRSYLRAAYSLAIRSKTDPAAPLAMRAFGVLSNPLASVGALSQFNRVRDRVLSAPELAAFLRRVDGLRDGAPKDALALCVALGGQRPMQLLRVKPADIDLDAATVTLYDAKGARQQPRRHVVPLTADAVKIFRRRLDAATDGAPPFSTDGTTQMRHETVSSLVADICADMTAAGEAREAFQLRDLRRTAETMLAALGVSSDVRAQLQSHGLGGVQARHYDRHSYSVEKRHALELWARHLAALKAGKRADVLPMRRKHAREHST